MNPHKGECEVTLGGTVYTMRPTFEAIVAFEDKAGVTTLEALQGLIKNRNAPLKYLAAAFHSGIVAAWTQSARPPTYNDVGAWIYAGGISNYILPFSNYITNSLCSAQELEENANKAAEGK